MEFVLTDTRYYQEIADAIRRRKYEVLSIRVTALPKTEYETNDTVDYAGLVVTGTCRDGSTKDITVGCVITPASGTVLNTAGTQTISISYNELGNNLTASFDITVENPVTLLSIQVTAPPTKTQYTVGESLDLSGMTVIANYSDNTSSRITAYTTSPANGANLNTAGTQTITISYTEGGITKTTTTSVAVTDTKTLSSIAITSMPKTAYIFDEPLDLTGLVVRATYSDGSTKDVQRDCMYSIHKIYHDYWPPQFSYESTRYMNQVDIDKVGIWYTEDDITKDITYNVTVSL